MFTKAGYEIADGHALERRRERVFLVLAGLFPGSMTMVDILGEPARRPA